MVSAVDLYSEIGKLKEEVSALQKQAVKVKPLEIELKKMTQEMQYFKVECEKEKAQKTKAEGLLNKEREMKTKMKSTLDDIKKKMVAMEKKEARLALDAKFDQKAREGQVKRARILEHNLTEVTHDNFLQTKLRKEAENRASYMDVNLQRERSLRLQDIHSKNKILIAKRESEKNEKIAEFQRFKEVANAQTLDSRIFGLEAAVKSQTKIISANDLELNASLQEIEATRLDNQRLRNELSGKDADILHHAEVRASLENECHRLQTELMVSATTASERSRPLSTASSGKGTSSLSHERAMYGRTRPETTSEARIRRRAANLEKSRNKDFSLSRVFTTTDGRIGTTGNRIRSSSENANVTLDEAFIIPIHAKHIDENSRARTATAEMTGAQGVYSSGGEGFSPPKPGTASVRFGQDKVFKKEDSISMFSNSLNSDNGGGRKLPSAMRKKRSGGGGESPEVMMGMNRTAPGVGGGGGGEFNLDDSLGSSTTLPGGGFDHTGNSIKKKKKMKNKTLNVPGSLFLGSGLGLRKSFGGSE